MRLKQSDKEALIEYYKQFGREDRIAIINPYPNEKGEHNVLRVISRNGNHKITRDWLTFNPEDRKFYWKVAVVEKHKNWVRVQFWEKKQCSCIPLQKTEKLGEIIDTI